MYRKDTPPAGSAPRGSEAHVWVMESAPATPLLGKLRSLLSPDELERARRFARAALSRRFIAHRAFLRLLLGRSLGVAPARLVFSYGPGGKPELAPPAPLLDFNLSHAGDFAVFALSAGKRVGIDVETVRKTVDLAGIAEYVFPAATAARLAALPPLKRLVRFYRLWTRLEAVAKAGGIGLGALAGLKEADLEGDSPFSIECGGSRWRVTDLELGPLATTAGGHPAALCLEGDDCRTAQFAVDVPLLEAWLAA